ncbi:Excinuclease ABC C subunit domain protein (modular protein) [uncultured delta proteobacterium]|uniref:Excinuclease ABC C subunit domain protein (Modular protein) n=1 Tax=uncultured delta proteobacterium TaxID=34034 RepID=A0A212KBG7_9DELT|nr:Excinuclease ABC C subunit domain protein (modular protein) [uncultured delta proteobacterium]
MSSAAPRDTGAAPAPRESPETPASDADSWKVYLLECADGTYYCGVAKHLDRRLAQHNGLRPGGAKYTRARRPVTLLAFRICPDKRCAYRLEYAVKTAPREKKRKILLSEDLPGAL